MESFFSFCQFDDASSVGFQVIVNRVASAEPPEDKKQPVPVPWTNYRAETACFLRSTYLPVSQRITTERGSVRIFMECKRPSNARRKAVFYCASGGISARR